MLKEKLRLLKETADYYSVDPDNRRCTDISGVCKYSPATLNKTLSEGCAVGRLLSKNLRNQLDLEGIGGIHSAWYYLPEEIQKYGLKFLLYLQTFHDDNWNWCSEGLTPKGKEQYESIRNYILNREI